MIKAKIDVTKIEKARLFKGEKGTYLDVVLIETPHSEYGDFMIVQEITKEERQSGKKGPILGNAKFLGTHPSAAHRTQEPKQENRAPAKTEDLDESVPF